MKVFKFGGASVRDAGGIKNLAGIVSGYKDDLVIVISAFGKTTNALEKVLREWLAGDNNYKVSLGQIIEYHASVSNLLFSADDPIHADMTASFESLKHYLQKSERSVYDQEYDQVVSFGEIWSTKIVCRFLQTLYKDVQWVDIRKYLVTDNRYRDANILWDESAGKIKAVFNFSGTRIFVTQGFIGGNADGLTTTLGREGSDYTAAVIANMLDAESVTVWKDVPGILNADPKWLAGALKLNEISYREAVEMTFSGAKVIHPKTIKPLHNKNIPLYVKSFLAPEDEGTVIKTDPAIRKAIPVFVRKESQVLISILPIDFSFVMGDNLSRLFRKFIDHGIKVNLVEASAVSIDVCVNDEREKVSELINDLKPEFSVLYNDDVEMISVRHYTPESVKLITSGREILLEQRTRSTVRFVVRTLHDPKSGSN